MQDFEDKVRAFQMHKMLRILGDLGVHPPSYKLSLGTMPCNVFHPILFISMGRLMLGKTIKSV